MKNLNNIIFSLFFTFSIFNLYQINFIYTIGKYGKVIILIYILIFIYWKFFTRSDSIFIFNKYVNIFLIMIVMFVIGAINYQLYNNDMDSYFYTSIFIIYMTYFICYVSTVLYYYKDDSFNIIINNIKNILYINMIIGFILSIVFNLSYLIPNKGILSFGGFLESGLIFGWLSLAAFFSTYFSNKKNKVRFILLVIFITFIIFSGGRGSQITLIVFYLIISYYKFDNIIKNTFFRYVLKIIIVLSIIYLIFSFLSNIGFKQINDLTTGRLYIWQLTLKEIYTNNIFYLGYGFGTFSDLILNKYYTTSYYFKDLLNDNSTLSLHSSYLSILVAGGFFSLLSFLTFIFLILKESSLKIKALILALLAGGIVEQFIVSPNIPISAFFWIVVILSIINNKNIKLRNFNE